MAGNYPDYPSWRMAYDRDGTQVFRINASNVSTQLSEAAVRQLNGEIGAYWVSGLTSYVTEWVVFLFPEPRDLDAYFAGGLTTDDRIVLSAVQVSTNTTNGLDGTWSTITNAHSRGPAAPDYREEITSTTSLGVRGVRFGVYVNGGATAPKSTQLVVHLFGERIPGATPKRLELWHPTLDQRLDPNHFDWGNAARLSTDSRQFRVKNLSGTLTATDVRVAMEALVDTDPSVVGQHTLSLDGGSWLPQVNVGNIAPGQASQLVTIRRDIAEDAVLGLWALRVFAEQTTWA